MLPKRVVNLKVGTSLKEMLDQRQLACGLQNPIPAILWGREDSQKEESLVIGFYERDELPEQDPIRIIEADGIEFLVIQDWICDALDGKSLDIVDGKLTVTPAIH